MDIWNYFNKQFADDKNPEEDDKGKKSIAKNSQMDNSHKKSDKNESDTTNERINVDEPLWNQDTYLGRWKHFAFVTDVRTIFAKEEKLHEAKELCELYKAGNEPASTSRSDIIWAKKLKESSFHPDNGELMNLIGRMSFQLPGNVILTAGMLAFYKTAKATISWQILNQAFNATVNYTNRNAAGKEVAEDTERIKQAFVGATIASCIAALSFRKLLSSGGKLAARWAPFFAVAVGNMANLPIMRQLEIQRGIPVYAMDNDKIPIMNSKVAAIKAISECVVCRIAMAAPGMLLIPVIIGRFEPYCFYQRRPWIGPIIEISMVGLFLFFMIPTALAIYPQKNSMSPELLKLRIEEYDEYEKNFATSERPKLLYYNKGL